MHSVCGNSSQATTRFSALDLSSPGIIEVMSSVKMCNTSGYLNFLVQQITLLQRFCGNGLLQYNVKCNGVENIGEQLKAELMELF